MCMLMHVVCTHMSTGLLYACDRTSASRHAYTCMRACNLGDGNTGNAHACGMRPPPPLPARAHTHMHTCRYAMLVTPINYMLCSVNVALFGSSAWHLGRKVTELCERARALSLSLSANLSLSLPRFLPCCLLCILLAREQTYPQ